MVSAVSGSTAALQDQIKRDQADLNDWLTCVSAKTPKGQAQIQKISGEISAARERFARIEATRPGAPTSAPASVAKPAGTASSRQPEASVGNIGGLIDTWA